MSRIRVFLTAVLVAVITAVGVPQVAQAVGQSRYVKKGSNCIAYTSREDGAALRMWYCGRYGDGRREEGATYNGHPTIKVRFHEAAPILCLDSAGQKSGTVKMKTCNTGNYQVLEVFNGSSASTKVLKSIGAWQHQGVHICLSSSGAIKAGLTWVTCNTSASSQQFNWTP